MHGDDSQVGESFSGYFVANPNIYRLSKYKKMIPPPFKKFPPFGKMLFACFADKLEHTEMDSSDTDCQWTVPSSRLSNKTVHFRKMTVETSEGYYILGHFENQARGMLQI